MRIGTVVLGAVLAIGLATPAAAQDPPSPRMFAGGLGGVTFGTETSSAIAGQVGVRIARDLFVIGEIGRMQNVLPDEVADTLEGLEDLLEVEGVPVEFDLDVPSFYGFGGIRWAPSGRRVRPFAEGGVGFAHLTLNGTAIVGGVDITDLIEDQFGDITDLSTNEFLLAFGGGVNFALTPAMSVDAGYRFTRIFADDPTGLLGDSFNTNVSMVYGAVKFLFGR
jgi:opacity protein-like surface antigen